MQLLILTQHETLYSSSIQKASHNFYFFAIYEFFRVWTFKKGVLRHFLPSLGAGVFLRGGLVRPAGRTVRLAPQTPPRFLGWIPGAGPPALGLGGRQRGVARSAERAWTTGEFRSLWRAARGAAAFEKAGETFVAGVTACSGSARPFSPCPPSSLPARPGRRCASPR